MKPKTLVFFAEANRLAVVQGPKGATTMAQLDPLQKDGDGQQRRIGFEEGLFITAIDDFDQRRGCMQLLDFEPSDIGARLKVTVRVELDT